MRHQLLRKFRRPRAFMRRQDGSATVEAVLWMPIFMVVFAFMVDTSMVFNGQSKVLRVIQDANRNMSVGRFTTNAEVENYINTELGKFNVVPTMTQTQSNSAVVLTAVTVPVGQLQIIGLFSAIFNLEVDVTAGHLLDSIEESDLSTSGMVATY